MQFSVSFKKAFQPIACLFVKSNKVVQFNAKFRLKLNWTLLCLFDFMIIAQIIVRFIMNLTNTLNGQTQMKTYLCILTFTYQQNVASVGWTCVY